MAEKPSIDEFATDPAALVTEPPIEYIRRGFTFTQPPVNFFNWIFKSVFQWVRYFDENIGIGSTLSHTHDTSRTYIEVPFPFSDGTPRKDQLTISKREESNIGGVSGIEHTGDGSVTVTVPSASFTAGSITDTSSVNPISTESISSSSPLFTFSNTSTFFPGVTDVYERRIITVQGNVFSLFDEDDFHMNVIYIAIDRISNNLVNLTISDRGTHVDNAKYAKYIDGQNTYYLVVAESESEALAGNAIIYNLTNSYIKENSIYTTGTAFANNNYYFEERLDIEASGVFEYDFIPSFSQSRLGGFSGNTGVFRSNANWPNFLTAVSVPTRMLYVDDTHFYMFKYRGNTQSQQYAVRKYQITTTTFTGFDRGYLIEASFGIDTNDAASFDVSTDSMYRGMIDYNGTLYMNQFDPSGSSNLDKINLKAFNKTTGARESSNDITITATLRDTDGKMSGYITGDGTNLYTYSLSANREFIRRIHTFDLDNSNNETTTDVNYQNSSAPSGFQRADFTIRYIGSGLLTFYAGGGVGLLADTNNRDYYVLYNLNESRFWTIQTNSLRAEAINYFTPDISPVYSNGVDLSNAQYIRTALSYTSTVGGAGNSSAVTLSGSPAFGGLMTYSYSSSNNQLSIVLDGTVSANSFHTFKIQDTNGNDLISLFATDATFNSSAKSFTWSGITSNPTPSAGTYKFVFEASGAGLAAFIFTELADSDFSIRIEGTKTFANVTSMLIMDRSS